VNCFQEGKGSDSGRGKEKSVRMLTTVNDFTKYTLRFSMSAQLNDFVIKLKAVYIIKTLDKYVEIWYILRSIKIISKLKTKGYIVMKKIIALILALSIVSMFTACGGADASSFYDEKYDYIEQLCAAIDDDDDNKIDDIQDEIEGYWEDYTEEAEATREDIEDSNEDDIGDLNEIINEADLSDSAREAVSEMRNAYGVASANLIYVDLGAFEDLFDTMLDYYEDIAAAAEDDDSDEVKDIAREATDEFEAINDEFEEAQEEYEDKVDKLRDEYSDEIVGKAEMLYNEAMMKAY